MINYEEGGTQRGWLLEGVEHVAGVGCNPKMRIRSWRMAGQESTECSNSDTLVSIGGAIGTRSWPGGMPQGVEHSEKANFDRREFDALVCRPTHIWARPCRGFRRQPACAVCHTVSKTRRRTQNYCALRSCWGSDQEKPLELGDLGNDHRNHLHFGKASVAGGAAAMHG